MAKGFYLGDPATGLARKVKKLYIGDPTTGVARKVKKVYIGDPTTGLARLCWASSNRKVFLTGVSRPNLYTEDAINFVQTSAAISSGGIVRSIASNGDIIIATHSDKNPTKSVDGGKTWNDLNIPFSGRDSIVAYGQDMWVIAQGLTVYYSTDLQTWNSSKITRVDQNIKDIIFTGNYFYIYACMNSGVNITSNFFVKLPSIPFNDIDNVYTRVEYSEYAYDIGNAFKYYTNNNIIFIAGYSKLYKSLDNGTTWSEFSYPQSWRPDGIVFGNGKHCAVYYDKSNGKINVYYSTDLISWTVVIINYTSQDVKGLEFINGRFIMPMKNSQVAVSQDCINWTTTDVPQFTSGHALISTTNRVYE